MVYASEVLVFWHIKKEKSKRSIFLTESEACERPPAAEDVLPSVALDRHLPAVDAAAEEWCDVFCAFFADAPPPLTPRASNLGDLKEELTPAAADEPVPLPLPPR